MNWTPSQVAEYAKRSQTAKADLLSESEKQAIAVNAVKALYREAKSVPKAAQPKAHGAKYSLPVVLAFFAECGLPKPFPEYQFAPDRKWRFDFAWPMDWP